MSDAAPAPRAHGRVRSTITVALVLALAGLLFTANARLARGEEDRHPENLAQLVESESQRNAALSAQVDALDDEIAGLSAPDPTSPGVDEDLAARSAVAAGTVAVTGPGVSVMLDDAPSDATYSEAFPPDTRVVHQQDIQAVVNALWAGGAEAMTLQGQRVTATSAFRCAGNILLLHGRVYSPPYVVEAIGDPEELQAALDRSEKIDIYQQYVEAVNLGWAVEDHQRIEMPRYEGALELEYARTASEAA
ncbi:DUF881 domain-containing protein [Cellulosimicrobium marinum]|uniref:DUF881 domain-containing protein n=1 Tax=Cellulosimicrobium marinum TaxID=1638992 RepID=UPI001E5949D7|nr:DUF881 domain-containing protein [Cellulosimicrobium marinum]MCB7135752.1 DUF881 domain-containing protein [Cellulosimicrobium marinum]